MLEDKVLIWRFNHGRPEVLHEIYDTYKRDLLTLATALLGDLTVAEDVVHDVFLSLLKLSGRLKVTGSLKGYLTTCVVNGDTRRAISTSSIRSRPKWTSRKMPRSLRKSSPAFSGPWGNCPTHRRKCCRCGSTATCRSRRLPAGRAFRRTRPWAGTGMR